jgi:hypothetical protein
LGDPQGDEDHAKWLARDLRAHAADCSSSKVIKKRKDKVERRLSRRSINSVLNRDRLSQVYLPSV